MINKIWHENIPENGVLCKEKSSGSIVRIMGKSNLLDIMVMDDCRRRNHFGTDELTPLAAEEWWKFAPWQDIDSAPRDGTLIFIHHNKSSCIGYYSDGFFIADANDCEILSPIKWLPLPTGEK